MRYIVAWMLGVPFSVIAIWYVVGHAACGRRIGGTRSRRTVSGQRKPDDNGCAGSLARAAGFARGAPQFEPSTNVSHADT
jgi:hypothetical protein